MADLRISDLVTASQLKDDDYYEIAQSESGTRVSYKTTLLAIAVQIATMVDFTSDLNTTSKKITGAINELKQLISLIPQFSIEVVQTLPTEDISDTTIYLVPAEDPEVGNYYEEYIHVNDSWELVGTTAVDLSAYYTKLEVDGLLADKLEADDFEANQTASANPITLETKQAGLAKSCAVSFGPIQDLHGYDHPWAGGVGKNKIPLTVSEIKAANASGGTWSGNEYTWNGVTYTILTDDDENVIGIDLYGTASANSTLYIQANNVDANLTQGRYSFSSGTSGSSSTTSRCYIEFYNTETSSWDGIATDTSSPTYETNKYRNCRIQAYTGTQFNHKVYKPQLESGTSTTTFAPYSNICPISGRTEASVNQGSVDITTLYNGQIQSGGNFSWNNNRISNANSSQMNTYFLKKGTHTLTFNKLNQSAPDLVECTVLTKNDNFEIVDNFATTWHSLPYTFELTADAYVYFTARKDYNTALNTADYKTLIIDETHTKEFGQTVYGGTLDLNSGLLTVDRIKPNTDSLAFYYFTGDYARFRISLTEYGKTSTSSQVLTDLISSLYEAASYDNVYNHSKDGIIAMSSNGMEIYIYDSRYTDITAFRQYLSDKDIVYPLATPTTIQLSPEALTLLKGLNVISTDGDKVQVEFSDIPVGDYSALLDYIKSLEARIEALEG